MYMWISLTKEELEIKKKNMSKKNYLKSYDQKMFAEKIVVYTIISVEFMNYIYSFKKQRR